MQEFLPATLDGWVGLLLKLGGFLLAIWGSSVAFIRKPLEAQLNGFGGRLKRQEETHAVLEGKVEVMERKDELKQYWQNTTSERLGKMEGNHEKLNEQVTRGITDFSSRIAGMESTLKFIAEQLRGKND